MLEQHIINHLRMFFSFKMRMFVGDALILNGGKIKDLQSNFSKMIIVGYPKDFLLINQMKVYKRVQMKEKRKRQYFLQEQRIKDGKS